LRPARPPATAGVVDRNDGAPIASRLKVGLSSYSQRERRRGRSLGEINLTRRVVWRHCVTGGDHAADWSRHGVSFRRWRLPL